MTTAATALSRPRHLTGVVVSAGKMMKTVKVRIPRQSWNTHLQKYYRHEYNLLVSDPNSSLLQGDVVTIRPTHQIAKRVHHIVSSIISPFGQPIAGRPPLLTEEELAARHEKKRATKIERRAQRRSAASAASEPNVGQAKTDGGRVAAKAVAAKAEASRKLPAKKAKVEKGSKAEETRTAENEPDKVVKAAGDRLLNTQTTPKSESKPDTNPSPGKSLRGDQKMEAADAGDIELNSKSTDKLVEATQGDVQQAESREKHKMESESTGDLGNTEARPSSIQDEGPSEKAKEPKSLWGWLTSKK